MTPDKNFLIEKLTVKVFASRQQMGKAASQEVASKIQELHREQELVNMIFAAAPSQNEFLESLIRHKNIAWERVNAFHMDEYIGLSPSATQSFGQWLKNRLFDKVPFRSVHYISSSDPEHECERYARLLHEFPPHICCLGIGENGHLAFNDPPVADFEDPELVKIVELEKACRQQQVNDGCFDRLDDVPETALTLTIPALMSAKHLYCVVPGPTKAKAVQQTLIGRVTTDCPASILRLHSDAQLYVDQDSYGLLA